MAKNFKKPSASTRESSRSRVKPSIQPHEQVNLGSGHSKDFDSAQDLSDDACSLNEKALGKGSWKIPLKHLLPKTLKLLSVVLSCLT